MDVEVIDMGESPRSPLHEASISQCLDFGAFPPETPGNRHAALRRPSPDHLEVAHQSCSSGSSLQAASLCSLSESEIPEFEEEVLLFVGSPGLGTAKVSPPAAPTVACGVAVTPSPSPKRQKTVSRSAIFKGEGANQATSNRVQDPETPSAPVIPPVDEKRYYLYGDYSKQVNQKMLAAKLNAMPGRPHVSVQANKEGATHMLVVPCKRVTMKTVVEHSIPKNFVKHKKPLQSLDSFLEDRDEELRLRRGVSKILLEQELAPNSSTSKGSSARSAAAEKPVTTSSGTKRAKTKTTAVQQYWAMRVKGMDNCRLCKGKLYPLDTAGSYVCDRVNDPKGPSDPSNRHYFHANGKRKEKVIPFAWAPDVATRVAYVMELKKNGKVPPPPDAEWPGLEEYGD